MPRVTFVTFRKILLSKRFKNMNFPAQFIVKNGDKKTYLCLKHMQRELVDGVDVESLPDNAEIQCSECVADNMNS